VWRALEPVAPHRSLPNDRNRVRQMLFNQRVADNGAKNDITESESLLIGRDFGVSTDIETGPNGNLYVVSISNGGDLRDFPPLDQVPSRKSRLSDVSAIRCDLQTSGKVADPLSTMTLVS
jgi:hypothetical protein